MRQRSTTDLLRRLLTRLVRRHPGLNATPSDARMADVDPRLPEQRLIDAAARYDRILTGDDPSRRRSDAAAAGVRTVLPTDPSDAGAPVWVRRLGDPRAMGSATTEAAPTGQDPAGPARQPRRPRR
jgi:hypothetical protein